MDSPGMYADFSSFTEPLFPISGVGHVLRSTPLENGPFEMKAKQGSEVNIIYATHFKRSNQNVP